jgi:small subunit ribosomal protein S4
MSRYRGPRLRRARQVGYDLSSTLRAATSKCNFERSPGMHDKRGRSSNFGVMKKEKQKVRYLYGLTEHQFKRTFDEAHRQKGSTGDNLLNLLERRLDNVVYRLGFAATRAEARQLVSHRSIMLNGRVCNIPSCIVSDKDTIEIKERSKGQLRVKAALQIAEQNGFPEWMDVDQAKFAGKFRRYPDRSEVLADINLNLIVEYYSR